MDVYSNLYRALFIRRTAGSKTIVTVVGRSPLKVQLIVETRHQRVESCYGLKAYVVDRLSVSSRRAVCCCQLRQRERLSRLSVLPSLFLSLREREREKRRRNNKASNVELDEEEESERAEGEWKASPVEYTRRERSEYTRRNRGRRNGRRRRKESGAWKLKEKDGKKAEEERREN